MSAAARPLVQLLGLVVALAVCGPAVLGQPKGLNKVTGTALITNIEYPDEVHIRTIFLKAGPELVYRVELEDPELVERLDLYSGQRVNVTGVLNTTENERGHPPSIRVDESSGGSIVPLVPRERVQPTVNVVKDPKVHINGRQTNIGLPVSQHDPILKKFKMLVIPIMALDANGNTCPGVQPIAYTKQDLENVMWGSRQYTLQGAYSECSAGRTVLDAANSRVTDFVTLPCGGSTSFGPWSIPGCRDQDGRGWEQESDKYVTSKFGIRLEDYDQITYLAPPTDAKCGWLAVADYGCAGNPDPYICRIWAHGWGWDAIAMYFHELGHHFYLSHSGQVNKDGVLVEYADISSTMGFCCALRCYNAPHSWQLGWLPMVELDGTRLTPGTTISFELARQAEGRGVRVTPNWAQGVNPLLISYRDTTSYDKDLLNTMYGSKTNIYQSPITSPTGGGSTQWIGAIADDTTTFVHAETGLTFRHMGPEGAGVRVSICRIGGPEDVRSCCYGRDNDCNGLGGQNDPACAPFMDRCSKFRYQWDLGETAPNPLKPSRVTTASAEVPSPAPTARAS